MHIFCCSSNLCLTYTLSSLSLCVGDACLHTQLGLYAVMDGVLCTFLICDSPFSWWRQGFDPLNKGTSSQFKLEAGSSSIQDEAEDVEEQPLVRHRSRRVSSGSVESVKEVEEMEDSPPSSPGPHDVGSPPRHNGDAFHSDEVHPSIRQYLNGNLQDRVA